MQDTTIQRTDGEGGDPSMARTGCIIRFLAAVPPPAALVCVITACANRRGDGGCVDTHCRFQIRTFWLSPLLPVVFFLVFLPVAVVAVLGTGLWLSCGLAERPAREYRARTSREAWRHASAADAVEASRRAEAAANVAASAASSAASAASRAQLHGRRP